MSHATLRIDGDRLWARLEALGEVGAVHGAAGERGCARLALTDADRVTLTAALAKSKGATSC